MDVWIAIVLACAFLPDAWCQTDQKAIYCNENGLSPAIDMCKDGGPLVGVAGQTLYIDSKGAPKFQKTECVCELQFDHTGSISISYRTEESLFSDCGIRFVVGDVNYNKTWGCDSTGDLPDAHVTQTYTNITYTKNFDDREEWVACLGITPALGSVRIKCFKSVLYEPEESGGWATWSSWSTCSSSCSTGTRSRERTCQGTSCEGESEQSRPCSDSQQPGCPVDGNWGTWSSWSPCPVSCGDSQMTRTRDCDEPAPSAGGSNCVGDNTETSLCNMGPCQVPVDGNWGTWSSWSPCPVSCGDSQITRSRNCDDPAPSAGGSNCVGNNTETSLCNMGPCHVPVDGNWGTWSSWSPCPVSCGDSQITRTRDCDDPAPSAGGSNCVGNSTETSLCNMGPCQVSVNGGWGQWTTWTNCGQSCGGGTQTRARSCDSPPPSGAGSYCAGESLQPQICNAQTCPAWSGWGGWTLCTATCGGGMQTRTRVCYNDGIIADEGLCPGEGTEQQACSTVSCPVDGSWGQWTEWSGCSLTCGDGVQVRTRTCTDPVPAYGGSDCLGTTGHQETRACIVMICPVNGGWASWGLWSACNRPCEGGTHTRNRTCTLPSPAGGGQACQTLAGHPDTAENETQSCNNVPCLDDTTTGDSGPLSTGDPAAGAIKQEEVASGGLGVIIGGVLGGLAFLILLIIIVICLTRRRRRKQNENGPRVNYVTQESDVTVTENELFNYDGETPAHAFNQLFVGGIPETPQSPGYIPHFNTENGEGYARIMDSTKSKNKPKERPKLFTFASPELPPRTFAFTFDTQEPSNKGLNQIATLSSLDNENDIADSNPELGFDNPGYESSVPSTSQGQGRQRVESPYDYIDHKKLKRDDAEFERQSQAVYDTHPKTVAVDDEKKVDESEEERYKKIITRNASDISLDDGGYLRSPSRKLEGQFVFPDTNQ